VRVDPDPPDLGSIRRARSRRKEAVRAAVDEMIDRRRDEHVGTRRRARRAARDTALISTSRVRDRRKTRCTRGRQVEGVVGEVETGRGGAQVEGIMRLRQRKQSLRPRRAGYRRRAQGIGKIDALA